MGGKNEEEEKTEEKTEGVDGQLVARRRSIPPSRTAE